jgi:ribonuclease HI
MTGGGSRRRPRRPGGTLKDAERRQLALASRRAEAPPGAPAPHPVARVICDGGSRGNPGPAAIAAVLLAPSGDALAERAAPIGRASAAEAEYRAIRLGLELAAAHGADPVEVCCDSRLAVAALQGRTPAEPGLAALAAEAAAAARAFAEVRWTWQPRARSQAADDLVRALLWPGRPAGGQAPRDSATRRIQ